ncbi:hypothetical protein SSX86_015938 [Deinandra increscens subsp. villosa]|uniref:Uncharacterized protein n=1 Tax=Deinandra increscens subsp. villosa TaxID=3103831 RepID=A0AAP0CWZ9_9ASTR
MIPVYFFVLFLLSCLPLLHSVNDKNISMPICPESFTCPNLASFKYPFYNVTDTQCGLIKVDCTSKGAKIQLGGLSYDIIGKFDSDILHIWNTTFEQLVSNKSCDALTHNLTPPSPSPLLYSISIFPNINLFKCKKHLTYDERTYAYIDPHSYNSYDRCIDYDFYYKYLNGTLPTDLPYACQVVQLPVKFSNRPGIDETDIFSLLPSLPSFLFKMSPSCDDCYKKGHRCDAKNGDVYCSDVIKEKPETEPTPDPNHEPIFTR